MHYKYISSQSLQMVYIIIDIFKMPLPVIYFKEERVFQVKIKCRLNHFCETTRQSWVAFSCWPAIGKVPRNAACGWIVDIEWLERDINNLETWDIKIVLYNSVYVWNQKIKMWTLCQILIKKTSKKADSIFTIEW